MFAAAGVRNTVGFDFHPQNKQLFFTDNGSDGMGDDSPDCELNRLPFGYNYYRSIMAQPRTSTFNLAVRFNGRVSNFGYPFCHAQGSGNPYRRDVGPGVPVADPNLNRGSSAVNCAGQQSKCLVVVTLCCGC